MRKRSVACVVFLVPFAVVLSSCSVAWRDSCVKPRHFRQFDFAPTVQDDKALNPDELPPDVQRAVNLFMLRTQLDDPVRAEETLQQWPDPATKLYYPVGLARDEGRYILLEVQNLRAFDANYFVVYSKTLRCIVGRFVWQIQG